MKFNPITRNGVRGQLSKEYRSELDYTRNLELPMTLSLPVEIAPTLLSAPIELAGDWGHMLPRSADLVVERMRHSCLDGVRLVSDRQPRRLRFK
jgi:hypothetical protein